MNPIRAETHNRAKNLGLIRCRDQYGLAFDDSTPQSAIVKSD